MTTRLDSTNKIYGILPLETSEGNYHQGNKRNHELTDKVDVDIQKSTLVRNRRGSRTMLF